MTVDKIDKLIAYGRISMIGIGTCRHGEAHAAGVGAAAPCDAEIRARCVAEEQDIRQAGLDASIARGVADADHGRVKAAAEVFDRLEAKYAAGSRSVA